MESETLLYTLQIVGFRFLFIPNFRQIVHKFPSDKENCTGLLHFHFISIHLYLKQIETEKTNHLFIK